MILSEDIVKAVDRIMPHNVEEYFSDIFEKGKPIIPQIESYSNSNGYDLPNGWKVELAKKVKAIMLKQKYDKEQLKVWKSLFDKFCE